MYTVFAWNDNSEIASFENLNRAKKFCRDMGYEILSNGIKAPRSFVGIYDTIHQIELSVVIYNPRFR